MSVKEDAKMKRIAIFCDGTWNRHDAPHPTNVVRMAQAVRLTAADGRKQHVIYQIGVGSGRGGNKLAKALDKFGGGALGWGLTENIEEVYRALVFCYDPGDEVFIFGFSRGAYTARSLAGLIRSCGIPPRDKVGDINKAVDRYRSRDPETKPDDPESFLFRMEFSPYTATSEAEFNWRVNTKSGLCVKLNLAYLGVWDTVGALGVPGFLTAASILNRKYQFHDMDLSRSVSSARHAVAIDERRRTFPPSLWDNLDRLNKLAIADEDDVSLDPATVGTWPYRQEWFPGNHSTLGGGVVKDGLAAASFGWVADGAMQAGLDMRADVIDRIASHYNVRETLRGKKAGMFGGLLERFWLDREGPSDAVAVSSTARARIACDGTYRPKTLDRVMDAVQRDLDKTPLLPD
jgi:uncharacterized protein (DUF2235 family)